MRRREATHEVRITHRRQNYLVAGIPGALCRVIQVHRPHKYCRYDWKAAHQKDTKYLPYRQP